MNALLDSLWRFNRHAKKLDAIAELLSGGEIGRRNRGNALDIYRALIELGAERKASQDRELLRGVVTLDIECRIGLGIAEPLGFFQSFGE